MASFIGKWSTIGSATTNSTALVAEASKAATLIKPVTTTSAGRYVLDVVDELGKASLMCLQFLSTDANNETYDAQFWGWTQIAGTGVWVPHKLGEISLTAGSKTVVIGGTTYFLPDTISIDLDATYNLSMEVDGANTASPGNGAAYVTLDPTGHELLEVEISRNSATAASAWLMWRQLSR